jgi:hypothetical protein
LKNAFVFTGFILSILLVGVLSSSLSINAQGPDSPGKSDVVIAFGKVPGQDLYAHVWVVVPQGSDKSQIVNQSLQNQGLKPFSHSDFSTTGMVHDQFTNGPTESKFVQNYNPAGEPIDAKSILKNTQTQWTSVANSNFAFSDIIIETDRCPSLVKECPGRQVTDGLNDVAWMSIKDRNTLGVTWFNPNSDEADMALNTNFSWNTNGDKYDIQTVYLHENGHVLGLGHSDVLGSIMEAVYAGPRLALTLDDKCGIQSLYGNTELDTYLSECTTTTEPPIDPVTGDATTADISYSLNRGKLFITIALSDVDSQPVAGTLVKIQLFLDDVSVGTGAGTTNVDGEVKFSLKRPSSGDYRTTVLEVAGVAWDSDNTTDPEFTK